MNDTAQLLTALAAPWLLAILCGRFSKRGVR